MSSTIILLIALGFMGVLFYFAATARVRRWLLWTAAGISSVLLFSMLLFFAAPQLVLKLLGYDAHEKFRLYLAKEQTSLDQHRALWEARQPANYRMTVHTIVWCAAHDCPPDEDARVETLFARAQAGINQGYRVSVSYDPELGYPTRVTIDRGYSIDENGFEQFATDSATMYHVTRFQIVP